MVPFSMTLNAPNQDFKFPPLFDANISDTVRDRHNYNGIYARPILKGVISNDLE